MELVDLTKFLVESLLSEKDKLEINKIESVDETIIQVKVSKNDIRDVIGRNGNGANALRTLVQASSYVKKLGKVRINIDSIE